MSNASLLAHEMCVLNVCCYVADRWKLRKGGEETDPTASGIEIALVVARWQSGGRPEEKREESHAGLETR